MDDLMIQMGARILERRKQMRLTQEELAERAGITPQTVSAAELGKKALRPENIVRISTVLDVSTDYLLLGKVTKTDYAFLSDQVDLLEPNQYRHLEDIVKSYMAAILEKD